MSWHRSDACIFSRRGPSRSPLGHLAESYAHAAETCTGNGRPSDVEMSGALLVQNSSTKH
eukprot:7040024-Pyramimonas_sp.AAC.1